MYGVFNFAIIFSDVRSVVAINRIVKYSYYLSYHIDSIFCILIKNFIRPR